MSPESQDFEEFSDNQIGDDLVSSAYSDVISTEFVEVAQKKSFQPWHLPRKHYCRLKQWAYHTQKLQRELKISRPARERPLRYLTLPGDELLDIRVLSRVMKNAGIKMQFLGFNTALDKLRSAESDLSFSEVRQLEGIYEKPSEIIQHRIENITDQNSTARQKVIEHLPFDVINLDFTGSMVGQAPLSDKSYFEVVKWLLEQQCNRNRNPWLFFLTVPLARDARTNIDTAKNLFSTVYSNAANKEFADELSSLLQISRGAILGEMNGQVSLDNHQYSKGLGLALSKWVLGLITTRTDQWALELIDPKSYRVYDDVPDMYSMCFKFIPYEIRSVDETQLTIPVASSANPISELDAGLELLRSISQTEDVDKLLDEDRDLLDQAIKYSAEFLAMARYDPNDYREWALIEMKKRNLLKSTEQNQP
ncbi:MAG: hypothetical protein KDJ52_18180 [Anaerolineae bacterium]|nr:hypothetical protein [Anaerolineae bacterium]